jgi:misacylated tRNA(Ala) deacylase
MKIGNNREIKSNKQYHPQMHSAEHILNQTMIRMFNCGRSFTNHIEKKKSKCDYHFSRNLTSAEIGEIELNVNQVIGQDLVVSEEFYSIEDAETKFNLSKLPDDSGEKIRIIKIGNYDTCPCSGMHISHTNEIGTFKMISTDYNDGILRIRFRLL